MKIEVSSKLTYRESSTVLAGLRVVQEMLEENPNAVLEMIHFSDCDPLTVEEIEDLCARLNSFPIADEQTG
jgi:hypothetical protein